MARNGIYREWLTPERLILIKGWARNGLTDKQICHNIGINQSTFCKWKNQFSELSKALKKGREITDIEVENALLKRALGYTAQEKIMMVDSFTKGKDGRMIPSNIKSTKIVEKHIPGDVTSQIFWLKNRCPDRWRDVNKMEVTQTRLEEKPSDIDLSKMSKDEILQITREAFKQADDEK